MTHHRRNALRQEIVAIAGESALNPPVDPTEPLWDARIGSAAADVFATFRPKNRRVLASPAKILSSQGIDTLRDAALVGGATLASAPDLSGAAIAHMWRNMRNLEPSMPLLFSPDIETVVALSFGDIGRVPLAAATQKWLPDEAPSVFAKHKPTVREAVAMVEENRTAYLIGDLSSRARFEDDVMEFASLYNQSKNQSAKEL